MQRLGNDWLYKQSEEDGETYTRHCSELKTAELVSSVRQSFSFRLVHSFAPNCFDSSLFSSGTNECMLSWGNRWPRTRTKMTMETTAVARATEAWVTVTVPGFNCAPHAYLSQMLTSGCQPTPSWGDIYVIVCGLPHLDDVTPGDRPHSAISTLPIFVMCSPQNVFL